jgi:hypothetical protein
MMAEQDVIFPGAQHLEDAAIEDAMAERADETTLAMVMDRQRELTELYSAIAEMLYLARAKWIGGTLLPWGLLTAGQRQDYLNEVRTLVKKAKGEQ